MDEFDLIARYFAPLQRDDPALVLGTGDNAAVFTPPPGTHCVVAVDTLVDGVHFPRGTLADAVGWRLAAVNLSDFAAMGAVPRHATLALTLPTQDETWLAGFAGGLGRALGEAGVGLIGGDTTRGPLTLTLQLMGSTDGPFLTRGGARAGDLVAVSGTLGDAAAGLARVQAGVATDDTLVWRFLYPTPRLALGHALRGLASAACDVSDGLLADLGHIAAASGVALRIDVDAVPRSAALQGACTDAEGLAYALGGGDDYELALCLPSARLDEARSLAAACATALTVIGTVTAGAGVHCHDAAGNPCIPPARGYLHFT